MRTEIYNHTQTNNDWQGTFGVSREDIIGSYIGDGWMDKVGGRYLDVVEHDKFTLHFTVRGNPDVEYTDRGNFTFKAVFNYDGDPKAVRGMKEVSAHRKLQGRGLAPHLVAHAARTTLLVGGNSLHVHPGEVGAYIWLAAGAIPEQTPLKEKPPRGAYREKKLYETDAEKFEKRFKALRTDPDLTPGWSAADRAWLQAKYDDKCPISLCEIAAKDLFVLDGGKPVKLGVFLLKNIELGASVFDFNNSWTVQRLHAYAGFDMAGEKAAGLVKPRPTAQRPVLARSRHAPASTAWRA